tara:strand:- start:870 stop:1685 length:816 start_codon:yes stop_codon:yes gene_type:complete
MNYSNNITALAAVLVLASLAGCGDKTPEPAANDAPAKTEKSAAIDYKAALNHPLRPDDDKARDADRKPAEVLEFVGIEPGMHVLDMFTGGGWYSEVIAHTVGEDGHVIAHSNNAYKNFVGDALEERFADGRVPQVTILMAENNELSLDENSLDAVMLGLSFHDMYHEDVENGWPLLDGVAFLAELRKGLKPGGVVGIIDHRAAAGSPPETGDSLHRIDPALVVANMEAAGFVLEAESDILANPDDDQTKIVFAPEIRGKTDRFVMRYRNPD